jgi:hypothetical protein
MIWPKEKCRSGNCRKLYWREDFAYFFLLSELQKYVASARPRVYPSVFIRLFPEDLLLSLTLMKVGLLLICYSLSKFTALKQATLGGSKNSHFPRIPQ